MYTKSSNSLVAVGLAGNAESAQGTSGLGVRGTRYKDVARYEMEELEQGTAMF